MSHFQSWNKYESAERWASYYTQIDEVLALQPTNVLEIGVGNQIVTQALKRQGIQVTTLDIDAALQPDVVGSVEHLPFADGSFDVVLCAEVLEHLPFEMFASALSELLRVSRGGVVVSLPHWGYTVRCVFDVPVLPPIRFAWKVPWSIPIPVGGEHFWEIGRTGFPLARIRSVLRAQATITRDFLSPWMPYHHFFCLRKLTPSAL